MPDTDEFERERRNLQARARYAWKKRNAEKASQPYTPKMPPEPGSLHEKLVQLLRPFDLGEEYIVQHIAHAAARLDYFVQLRNHLITCTAADPAEIQSATECYKIARKTLRKLVSQFRSRRPAPREKDDYEANPIWSLTNMISTTCEIPVFSSSSPREPNPTPACASAPSPGNLCVLASSREIIPLHQL